MTEFDELTRRLVGAADSLDRAIERYVTGDLRLARSNGIPVVTTAVVGVLVAGSIAAVSLIVDRDGGSGTGSPTTVMAAPASSTDSTEPSDPGSPSDTEAWAEIDWLFSLTPYGPEGNRYQHLIIQDQLQRCMNARGFEYRQVPFTPDPRGGDGYAIVPPLPTETQVRAHGYAAFNDPGGAVAASPPATTGDEAPVTTDLAFVEASAANDELAKDPRWEVALYGRDTKVGSCTGSAFGFVDERVGTEAQERYRALLPEITQLADPTMTTSGRLPETLDDWRRCMVALGHEAVDNPFASASPYFRPPDTQPDATEIATALDDLRCRTSSGFREAYRDTITENIATFRTENRIRLSDLATATERETDALGALATELGLE